MVVGISGGSGSGKTTFSVSLAKALSPENCLLISRTPITWIILTFPLRKGNISTLIILR